MNSANARRPTWTHISLSATVVAVVSVAASFWVGLSPGALLAALFVLGGAAGAWAARQAWLAGIIVGLPFAWVQLTRASLAEFGNGGAALSSSLYWLVVPSVSVLATGVAIMGALAGSWARNRRGPASPAR